MTDEQLLQRSDVVPIGQQVRRKGMPEHVRTDPLRETRFPRGLRHRALDHRLVQVIAGGRTEPRIATHATRRKQELPPPLGRGLRIFRSSA